MQPPSHVIFPTYEDDSFNSISPPPLYEVKVVLTTTIEDDESVARNENGDDRNVDEDDYDDEDDRDDEDLDLHGLPGEEKPTDDDHLLPEDGNYGDIPSSTPDCEKTPS